MIQTGGMMHLRTSLIQSITLLFAIIAFVSCNKSVVYQNYQHINGSKWQQDSVLKYYLDIPDSTKIYNLSLNVRNEGRYAYSNLWAFIKIIPPKGDVLNDTIELTLAEPSGKWLGSGLGDLYDRKYPYKTAIFFPVKGFYNIEVRHGMRSETGVLSGIADFGITLEKAN
jgi:gliding motility-associated lipoprotein GldH